jgi:ADP-ribosylglycohydrolase
MYTQQTRPVITPAMREQAAKQPNTWLYVVDPIFTDPSAEIPPWGFIGGYRVDAHGEITDDFSPNPNYRPSPVALRLPAPNNDLERALQLTTTGYAQGQALLQALLEAEVVLFAQPQGSGLFTMEHESGRRQLQVFTSDAYLPPNWTTWQRMTGWQLANEHRPNGLDLQLNPTSAVKARIPGEDLVRAAGLAQRTAEPTSSPATGLPNTSTVDTGKFTPVPPQALASKPAPPAPPESKQQPKVPSTSQTTTGSSTVDPTTTDLGQRFLGAVLAGAAGDALGAPVEFYPLDQIRSRHGERGVSSYDHNGDRPGEFTDDTQMTLFTMEGLVRGHIAVRRGVAETPMPAVQLAYQRWLHTQGYAWTRAAGPFDKEHPEPTGWLISQRELFSVRAPSSSCISALRGFATSGEPSTFAADGAQDASGLTRCAPIALWSDSPQEVFELAAATAALTCPHPNGYLPAGVHAVLVQRLIRGEPLREALRRARELLAGYAGHEPTEQLLASASDLAREGVPTGERLKEQLGSGWNAHEALAIAVCAALATESISSAVTTAVNHSGDSDTTGAVCGTIVGARYGQTAVPGVWLRDLQQREVLETAAREALTEFGEQPSDEASFLERYPADHDRSELVFPGTPPAVGEEPPASGAQENGAEAEHEQEQDPGEAAQESSSSAQRRTAEVPRPDAGQEQARDEQLDKIEKILQAHKSSHNGNSAAPADSEADDSSAEAAVAESATDSSAEGAAAQEESASESAAASADAEPASSDDAGSGTAGAEPSGGAVSEAASPGATSAVAAGAAVAAAGVAAGTVAVAGDGSEDTPANSAANTAPPAPSAPAPNMPNPVSTRGDLADDRTTWITGCLLGSAIGDALGQPIADDSLASIRDAHGPDGVRDLVDGAHRAGSIGDATQMSLFTLEGLIRAGRSRRLRGEPELDRHVQLAYQRWLHTQGITWADAGGPDGGAAPDGWLIRQPGLFARRSPGDTCLRALRGHADGEPRGSFENRLNASKGSGGVVRAAPAGLWSDDPTEVFRVGAATAALTHGHPSGFLPAGALAVVVQQLVAGESLPNSVDRALTEMSAWGGHEGTLLGLRGAIELAASGDPTAEQITEQLGSGHVAEQALAIAVCAALTHPQSYTDAVLMAVNHSGASHSTAAICGAIMGAAQGASAVPVRWRDKLELHETIEALARDAAVEFGPHPVETPEIAHRYPLPEQPDPSNTGGGATAAEPTYDTAETEASESATAQAGQLAPERSAEQPAEQSTSGTPGSGEPAVEEHAVEEPSNHEPAPQQLVHRGALTDQTEADTAQRSGSEQGESTQDSTSAGVAAGAGALAAGSLADAGGEQAPRPAPPAQQPQGQGTATPQEPVWESPETTPSQEGQPEASESRPSDFQYRATSPESADFPYAEDSAQEAVPATTSGAATAQAESGVDPETFDAETEEPDDLLSDEELRLLAAWRKFRDGENDTPTDLSQGLRKLLTEAFGEERAAQLVGDAAQEPSGELAHESTEQMSREQRLAGCVLGTAIGDALAAPWGFADLATILRNNPDGVREYSEFFGRRGVATALGQQSVFLLDGLLRAGIRSRHEGVGGQVPNMVRLSLQHWACTQGARFDPALPVGLLTESSTLRVQRFPDETSLVALTRSPHDPVPTPSEPPNAATTATAVARGAAVGFHADNPQTALSLGAEVGVLTHGHPDGYLPAGALAAMVTCVQDGQTLSEAVQSALSHLEVFEGSETTAQKLRSAVEFAAQGPVAPALLEELGAGWEAPEALAIAVAAALSHPNELAEAVSLAATHSGNSTATAAICGGLLGAARGYRALPQEWLDELETRELLEQMLADDARVDAEIQTGDPVPDWANRYLG